MTRNGWKFRVTGIVRDWFLTVLRARTRATQQQFEQQRSERQSTPLQNQKDRLLNLGLLDEIDKKTFAAKNTETRDRIAELGLQVEAINHGN